MLTDPNASRFEIEPEFSELECPICGTPTDSLKLYEVLRTCVFIGFAFIRMEHVTACPPCLRRHLWRRCLINLVPANLLWVAWVLPRTVIQVLMTRTRGHSKAVLAGEHDVTEPDNPSKAAADDRDLGLEQRPWCEAWFAASNDGWCPSCNRPVG